MGVFLDLQKTFFRVVMPPGGDDPGPGPSRPAGGGLAAGRRAPAKRKGEYNKAGTRFLSTKIKYKQRFPVKKLPFG
jgi:hypothetical protein